MAVIPTDQILTNVLVNIINYRTKLQLHMAADNNVGGWGAGGTSNEWYLVREPGTSYFKIINARTSLQLHMAADNNVGGWGDAGNSNLWRFIDPESVLYPKGWNIIENQRTGLQLHLDGDNNARGHNTVTNGSNQWLLTVASAASLVKIDYHTDELQKTLKPSDLVTLTFNNNTDTILRPTWKTEYGRETISTHSFSWKFGYTFSSKLTVSAIVLGIGLSGEASHTLNMEIHENTQNTETTKQGWTFELPTEVPARRKVKVLVTLREATVSVPYTAHFAAGGATWTQQGTYDGVRYGDIMVDVQDVGPATPSEPGETIG
jgi:hypothetical protein